MTFFSRLKQRGLLQGSKAGSGVLNREKEELSSEILSRIRRIHIRTSRSVNAMMAGNYRSAFRGTGMEFEEVREYAHGDDVKNIDWKVSARMNHPYIKLYREERELVIMLLLDMSSSTSFGSKGQRIRDIITETAAVLAFNAIKSSDKVGAIIFTDRVEKFIPPKKGRNHVWMLIRELVGFVPKGRGTDISVASAFLSRVMRRRSVVFYISDFMNTHPGPIANRDLKFVASRHDCVAAVVNDPGLSVLPSGGILRARDPESGEIFELDCFSKSARVEYAARFERWREGLLSEMRRFGVDCLELDASRSPADSLNSFFQHRERRLR